MKFERSAGILLHPTSLPGPYGIGDIGPQAYRWVDYLADSGCALWQVLPLGPTGYGDSPYQCFSAFAGNPYLISPELLLDEALLLPEDLADAPEFPSDRVDFGALIPWKLNLLDRAYLRFEGAAPADLRAEFADFCIQNAAWLEDFCLFMALKDANHGAPWSTWEASLRDRLPKALDDARLQLDPAVQKHAFRQFLFFRQWHLLRQYAHQRGVQIIGDVPIFVAHDSADVWANPHLFFLDERGMPSVVAGVPPDYYSPTGQLWGNPLYRWKVHKADGYQWWLERMRSTWNLVDIVRMDHFRGFAAYWRVSGKARTAEKGRWVSAPGKDFFRTLRRALGELPIIAEDLGVITPDVVELREHFSLPGMKVLVFAFDNGSSNPFLPHQYTADYVAYTGTHDNDTVLGWYTRVPESERDFCRRYLDRDGSNVSWDLIRTVWASVAVFALAPLQDFLELGNEARMNYPGNPQGNWSWRMPEGALTDRLQERIFELNELYGRENAVR